VNHVTGQAHWAVHRGSAPLAWIVFATAAGVFANLAEAGARKPVTLEIAFHVAQMDAKAVVEDAFIDERLERANEIFAPYGVGFAKATRVQPLGSEHAVIESRADRDALGAEVGKGVIDCFVVRSLHDVDDPTQMRRGVHWHSQTHAGAHFVILSSIAGRNVLAHELGHFLGNPRHSEVPDNLMSYQPDQGLPVLDAAQTRKLERTLRGYLDRHELRPVRADKRGSIRP
jgi:hypothetical protein